MKLLIVGFNARPIAKSAIDAGHTVGVIDYFGDMDLLKLTQNCFSVLRQKPNQTLHRPLHRRPAEYLYYLSEIMIEEQNDFDGILVGSVFDRYPQLIEKLEDLKIPLFANTAEKYRLIRDRNEMNRLARRAGFEIPEVIQAKDFEEFLEIARNSAFPLVSRGSGGGGGAGIRLWQDYNSLEDYYKNKEPNLEPEDYWLQKYIDGIHASASVINSEKGTKILSVNEQLIGNKILGAPSEFAYSGNIVPIRDEIANESDFYEPTIKLFESLNLKGSNGVDFVIRNNEPYFMEVNPRFQGSLECIQYATGINLVKTHIDSFLGHYTFNNPYPEYERSSVKGILFSDYEKNFQVKRYPRSKWIVDRSHPGVILERTDPFCSIVLPAKNGTKGYQTMLKIAKKIRKKNIKH